MPRRLARHPWLRATGPRAIVHGMASSRRKKAMTELATCHAVQHVIVGVRRTSESAAVARVRSPNRPLRHRVTLLLWSLTVLRTVEGQCQALMETGPVAPRVLRMPPADWHFSFSRVSNGALDPGARPKDGSRLGAPGIFQGGQWGPRDRSRYGQLPSEQGDD